MTFRNSVVGGDTLVRSAIQSPNFVTGVSGWTIKRDGSAEFNNVTIRGGTVISGTSLYYNGAPALGNLFMSISATSGTDSFGNAYVKGAGLYGSVGTLTAKDTAGNTTIVTGALPVNGLLASLPGISMNPVSNTGDPASIGALDPGGGADLGLILTSPSPNTNGVPGTDFAQIYMTGPYTSPAPSITMVADSAGGTINLNTVTIDDGGSITMLGGEVVNVGASASTAVFASLASATTDDLLSARITGDTTNSRFVINHAGEHLWGPGGGTAVDTNLYRSAANTLKTDDSFTVGVDLTVLGVGQDLFAIKASSTSRASTTSPTADPHLALAVSANATYQVEAVVVWTNGGGGFRCDWTAPASATMVWTDNDGTGIGALGTDDTFAATTGTTLKGALVVAGTSGTLTLRWAQNTSNVANTTLLAGCYLWIRRLS